MGESKIEWTDTTWNPVTGCTKVSAGCKNCYAKTLHDKRYEHNRGLDHHAFAHADTNPNPFAFPPQYDKPFETIQLMHDRLTQPLRWRKPKRVFVNSVSDLFHEHVPDAFLDQLFAVMALTPHITYQVLTKRPERMRAFMEVTAAGGRGVWTAAQAIKMPGGRVKPSPGWPLPNVLLGVSIENEGVAWRAEQLRHTPAARRFLSLEPLLGPLQLDLEGIDWVIVGGESGAGARPVDVSWIRSIVQQCQAAGVAVFVKQLGGRPVMALDGDDTVEYVLAFPAGHVIENQEARFKLRDRWGRNMEEFPEDIQRREFPAPAARS